MQTKPAVIVVGAGAQGKDHLKAWPRAGAMMVSVVDTDGERADALARRFKIGSSFTLLEAALEKASRPLIVDIVTPPQTHKNLILTSLEAGAAVLVEKPMVLTAAESREVRKKAEEVGRPVCVLHNWLFEPVMRKAVTLINKGAIGDIRYVHINVLNTPQEAMIRDPDHWVHKLAGGRLAETLPHVCYLLCAVLGQDIQVIEVAPGTYVDLPWVSFDSLSGIVQGQSATATFHLTFAAGSGTITVDVVGTRGAMRAYLVENFLERSYVSPTVTRAARAKPLLSQTCGRVTTIMSHSAKVATRTWIPGHLHIMRECVKAVQGKGAIPVTLDEAVATVSLTEAILSRIPKVPP